MKFSGDDSDEEYNYIVPPTEDRPKVGSPNSMPSG